jgi:hypothetical protein
VHAHNSRGSERGGREGRGGRGSVTCNVDIRPLSQKILLDFLFSCIIAKFDIGMFVLLFLCYWDFRIFL